MESGAHTPVMLWGPPGVGNSQIIGQISARHGAVLIDVRLSQMEPTDLRGNLFRSGAPAFWLAGQHAQPDLLLYFTDAEREFPRAAPPYPVIWLAKGGAGVPWGERVQFN